MNIRLDNRFFIIIISSITISESPVHIKSSKEVMALITRVGTVNKVVEPHGALK